jgi:hypothetical protein
VPEISRRDTYREFLGKGAAIQAFALLLMVGGTAALGVIGAGLAVVPAAILFVAGSRASRRWRCGACKNPLSTGDVTVCPVCLVTLV